MAKAEQGDCGPALATTAFGHRRRFRCLLAVHQEGGSALPDAHSPLHGGVGLARTQVERPALHGEDSGDVVAV